MLNIVTQIGGYDLEFTETVQDIVFFHTSCARNAFTMVKDLARNNTGFAIASPDLDASSRSAYNGHLCSTVQLHRAIGDVDETSIRHILQKRKSVRNFRAERARLEEVSAILELALFRSKTDQQHTLGCAYPSAGGLYPVMCIILFCNTAEVTGKMGVYDPYQHRLTRVASFDTRMLADSLVLDESKLNLFSFFVVQVADLTRTLRKYGRRSYRFCLLEAGHQSQCLQMAAVEQGFGTCLYGGYEESKLRRTSGVSGREMLLMNVIGFGLPV